MHLDLGQLPQDRRNIGQFRPVELDVLTGGEMAVAAIMLARDMCKHTHLLR